MQRFIPGEWGIVPCALIRNERITLAALKAYVSLASFQGTGDECFPSLEKIAERAGMAVDNISRSISVLRREGWVQSTRRGLGKTNLYRVLVDAADGLVMGDKPDTSAVTNQELSAVTTDSLISLNLKTTTSKTRRSPAVAGSGHHEVMQGLEKIHGQQYANYKREGKALKDLLGRVEKMYPGKVAGDLVFWMAGYLRSLSNDKFWKTVPVSPSSLLSHWDRLYTMARAKAGEQDWEHMSSPMTKKEEA